MPCPCVAAIGPVPPPVNGQSVVFSNVVEELAGRVPCLHVANTGGRKKGTVLKLRQTLNSFRSLVGSGAVYIAVKAGSGMWLTAATAGFARLIGARIFLHHHSYAYVRQRQRRMVALNRIAGPGAQHIVLSEKMSRDLRSVIPEIREVLVLGNACLVDRGLAELPLKGDSPVPILGHLSNLGLNKGLDRVVDLAVAMKDSGMPVRLIIGGPATDGAAREHIERASLELSELFEYRGPLAGVDKRRFFSEITHFVFPSRYDNEAMPLVLYEALAAGVICIATCQGGIPELLDGSPAIMASDAANLVSEVLPSMAGFRVSPSASEACRLAYMRDLDESQRQLTMVVDRICSAAAGRI